MVEQSVKRTATCHVFGQTHCVSAKEILNRDKDAKLNQNKAGKKRDFGKEMQ